MRVLAVLLLFVVGLVGLTSGLGYGPVVVNPEGKQRVALWLGKPTVITEAGVSLAIANTRIAVIEGRWMHLSSEPREIQTRDRELLTVDHYVIWRIADPLIFREAFPESVGGNLTAAEAQIDRQTRSKVREVIGEETLQGVLNQRRTQIMDTITAQMKNELAPKGVAIGDIRINRTELPRRTEENVYARMRSERQRLARKYRAEGDEEARKIRAEADRKRVVIEAEAVRDSEILRGEGDAEATRIYAESYGADPEFYEFVRSLEAYRKTIGAGTTMVLSPNHPFFKMLQSDGELPAGR